ncbi:MAG: stage III sporulation protein AF [Bacillota bacterium]
MDALKEWVRSLIMLVILASVLELLLPMNSMKKFVRMAMGLLIVLGVVRPVVGLLGQPVEVKTDLLVSEGTTLPSMNQIMVEAGRFRERNQALLLQEAERRLTDEARAAAREVEGVADARVTLRIAPQGAGGESRVEGVTVVVTPGSRYGQVRPVEPVRVAPSGSEAPGTAPAAGQEEEPMEAEIALAEDVRREVAARLGLSDGRLIQVLVDRPGQPRR